MFFLILLNNSEMSTYLNVFEVLCKPLIKISWILTSNLSVLRSGKEWTWTLELQESLNVTLSHSHNLEMSKVVTLVIWKKKNLNCNQK